MKKFFTTRDLYLAAYLIFQGIEPVSLEKIKGNKVLFHFPSSSETYKAILTFNDSFMPYIDVMRDLRGRVLDELRDTRKETT
jgi:hypothetical protein